MIPSALSRGVVSIFVVGGDVPSVEAGFLVAEGEV
jgi:hypothetical protein